MNNLGILNLHKTCQTEADAHFDNKMVLMMNETKITKKHDSRNEELKTKCKKCNQRRVRNQSYYTIKHKNQRTLTCTAASY